MFKMFLTLTIIITLSILYNVYNAVATNNVYNVIIWFIQIEMKYVILLGVPLDIM